MEENFSVEPPYEEPSKYKSFLSPHFLAAFLILTICTVFLGISVEEIKERKVFQPKANVEEEIPFYVSLESPKEDTVVVDDKVEVSGKTLPGTVVFVYTEDDVYSSESDEAGNFSLEILVNEGINTVTLTAFGENGEEQSIYFDVVYDKS